MSFNRPNTAYGVNQGQYGNMSNMNYPNQAQYQNGASVYSMNQGNNPIQNPGMLRDPQHPFASLKEAQIQELKSKFSDFTHKPHTNLNPPYDILEFTLQLDNASLKIPLAILLEKDFPSSSPKIFVRTKLKHRFIEIGSHGPEIIWSNFYQWNKNCTLSQIVTVLKSTLEKEPPRQEKIVEEVNSMLAKVNPEDFKELVNPDWLSSKNPSELKGYAANPNFDEIIVGSKQYKKIAQNIIDCANFNEKLANELIHKKETLEATKKNSQYINDRIIQLRTELAQKQEKSKRFADRFNRPNLEKCLNDELTKLDRLSDELDQGLAIGSPYNQRTPTGNTFEDTLAIYFETRKKYHQLSIMKEKFSSIPN